MDASLALSALPLLGFGTVVTLVARSRRAEHAAQIATGHRAMGELVALSRRLTFDHARGRSGETRVPVFRFTDRDGAVREADADFSVSMRSERYAVGDRMEVVQPEGAETVTLPGPSPRATLDRTLQRVGLAMMALAPVVLCCALLA